MKYATYSDTSMISEEVWHELSRFMEMSHLMEDSSFASTKRFMEGIQEHIESKGLEYHEDQVITSLVHTIIRMKTTEREREEKFKGFVSGFKIPPDLRMAVAEVIRDIVHDHGEEEEETEETTEPEE